MIAPPLLQLTSISKSFDAVAALRDVSFDLQAGEVHALVGENGAGKSTLVKIISGAEIPDAGAIEIAGQSVTSSSPQLSRELGVAVIYQQPALFPDLSVAENIALRSERSRALGFVGWPNRRRVARRLLDDAGCDAHVDALAGSLSMPQQQLVEIAAALGANARILILDEPTASLSNREVENLFGLIDRLRSRGVGMIYISHRLEELQRVADRVTVLRDGRHVETGAMTDMTRERLIRLMVGREINAVYPVRTPTIGKVAIEIRNLSCAASGVRDVSVAVHAGEIVGLAGLVGSGRSELARTLFGLTPATSGQILLSGLAVQINAPSDAIDHGVAYVPEDRRRHGVISEMSVAANSTLAILREISTAGLISHRRERDVNADFSKRLAIKAASSDSPASTLSGGNQQKVALARWLATKPMVLILDEPTQGVDVGAKSDIHRLIGELADSGLAVILISSEMPEILGMSDRIAVMRQGRICATLARDEASQEKLLAIALEGAAA